EKRDENELRRVGRLERKEAEGKPASRAHDRMDENEEHDKKKERDGIARKNDRRPADDAQIERREKKEYGRADEDPYELSRRKRHRAEGVHRKDAEERKRKRNRIERPLGKER